MPYYYRIGEIPSDFHIVLVNTYQIAREKTVHRKGIFVVIEFQVGDFLEPCIPVFGNKGSGVYPREMVHNRIFIRVRECGTIIPAGIQINEQ
jgi:hypothetical protein